MSAYTSFSTITPDQMDCIRAAVTNRANMLGVHQSHIWPMIRRRFGLKSYYRLPRELFADALAFDPNGTAPQPETKSTRVSVMVSAQLNAAAAKAARKAKAAPTKYEQAVETLRSDAEALRAYRDDPLRQEGKGAQTLEVMKARLYRLQRRMERLSDAMLDLMDDMEAITGVSGLKLAE